MKGYLNAKKVFLVYCYVCFWLVLGAAAVNGKIYAIGGYAESGREDVVEEYDPATNTWTTKTAMPTARDGLAAMTINNKIYAIGGYDSSDAYIATVEEYIP